MNCYLFSAIVLGICTSLVQPSAAQSTGGVEDHTSRMCYKIQAEKAPDKAENTKTRPLACEGSHSVALSWKASASLSSSTYR